MRFDRRGARGALLLALAAVLGAFAGAGCGGGRAAVPPGVVKIHDDSVVIRQGAVGARQKFDATYVLVDVENTSSADRMVGVGGTLRAEGGRELGSLRGDQVLIPAGHTRVLVLVFDRVAPEAIGARVVATSADALGYRWPIEVGGVGTEREPAGGLAVTARLENTATRRARYVKVGAAFYDRAGRILERPFTFIDLDPKLGRPVRFVGPADAERAVVFLGEAVYE